VTDKTINDLGGPLAAPAADDYIPIWDTSAGQTLKIRRDVFTGGVMTGGGTVATAGFTLTVPATGTAALYTSGTFTPDLRFGGTTTGITYVSRGGYYTKIVNVCYIEGWIELSSKGSASGVAIIAALPFAVGNTANLYPVFGMQWINMAATLVAAAGVGSVGGAHMDVNGVGGAAATLAQLTDAAFANNSMIRFSGFYFV
jgi:hypothetical protein